MNKNDIASSTVKQSANHLRPLDLAEARRKNKLAILEARRTRTPEETITLTSKCLVMEGGSLVIKMLTYESSQREEELKAEGARLKMETMGSSGAFSCYQDYPTLLTKDWRTASPK